MGAIFYSEHNLIIPKTLQLGKNFTISFYFFNPPHFSKSYHVLLQDSSGLGALIAIDKSRERIGSFTVDGVWVDAGINLNDEKISKQWVNIVLSYSENDQQSKIYFYLDGKLVSKHDQEKLILSKNIKYVANSMDYNEAFGILCDLRVYNYFAEEDHIKEIIECMFNYKNSQSK